SQKTRDQPRRLSVAHSRPYPDDFKNRRPSVGRRTRFYRWPRIPYAHPTATVGRLPSTGHRTPRQRPKLCTGTAGADGRLPVIPRSRGLRGCRCVMSIPTDWLFPTYRDTVAVLARGVEPMQVMTGFRGDWHQGYDPHDHNTSIQSTPLTTQLLHAVGMAHAARLKGEDMVVLGMVGD